MNVLETRKAIQRLLHVADDGDIGPVTTKAFRSLAQAPAGAQWPEVVHRVWATSFADPKDIAAFKKCKATGKTDKECFRVGDNGIGTPELGIDVGGVRRGVDTTQNIPMCALPPEDWRPLGKGAPGAMVMVTYQDRQVVCFLRDTMPSKEKITNGAGLDLNYSACKALGLVPPIKVEVTWQWL